MAIFNVVGLSYAFKAIYNINNVWNHIFNMLRVILFVLVTLFIYCYTIYASYNYLF